MATVGSTIPYYGCAMGGLQNYPLTGTAKHSGGLGAYPASQDQWSQTMANLFGPGFVTRTESTTTKNGPSGDQNYYANSDFSKSGGGQDGIAMMCVDNGGVYMPDVHHTVTGGGSYYIPALNGTGGDPTGSGGAQTYYEWVYANLDRYAPRAAGVTSRSSNVTRLTQTTAGNAMNGFVLWEGMNEPNTPTGNAAGNPFPADAPANQGNIGLRFQYLVKMVDAFCLAVSTHAAANGWSSRMVSIPFALGSIDFIYLDGTGGTGSGLLGYLSSIGRTPHSFFCQPGFTHLACHVYMNADPTIDGGTAKSQARKLRTFQYLRNWLNANGCSTCRLAMTEGGYSGSDVLNRYNRGTKTGTNLDNNIIYASATAAPGSDLDQGTMTHSALQVIDNGNNGSYGTAWGLDVFTPYTLVDNQAAWTSANDTLYWQNSRGHVLPGSTLKLTSLKPSGTVLKTAANASGGELDFDDLTIAGQASLSARLVFGSNIMNAAAAITGGSSVTAALAIGGTVNMAAAIAGQATVTPQLVLGSNFVNMAAAITGTSTVTPALHRNITPLPVVPGVNLTTTGQNDSGMSIATSENA